MYRSLIFLTALLPLVTPGHGDTLQQIADQARPGILGVAVYDFPTGKTRGINQSLPFPMQSVFKAFLSAAVLARVDAGKLTLGQEITITPADIRDGVGPVDHSGGGIFTLHELLVAAIVESDNTAADALLRLIGGPAEATAWLRSKGFGQIRIDRDERSMARDAYGIPADFAPGQNASALRKRISKSARHAAFAAALTDPRDTATPEEAVRFLVALWNEKLLSKASTRLLLQWMQDTSTGPNRLKAGFPPQAFLAHKTGTSGTFEGVTLATNDIGLVLLPDGRKLAVAVFLAHSPASEKAREAVIAACARAATE